ncbi:transmembrane protein [Thraustotheca clavata]|uniref:Transmembrane protein n=1 Tax=Thraustotheca clavata TaxID=74557 RepID=A0A1V9YTQ4_9STRA|nr:transmembrane protein [Thraustotheca clavata]
MRTTLVAFLIAPVLAWVDITWSNMNVNGDVTIPTGQRVTVRNSNTITGELNIASGAILQFDVTANVYLQVGNLEINGALNVGTESQPYTKTGTIALGCSPNIYPASNDKRNGINIRAGGSLAVFGQKGTLKPWTQLAATAEAGTSCINVVDYVDWVAGDTIIVATTDYDPNFTERRTIVGFGANGCLKLDSPLLYMHYGEITEGIDERAEVGLLSRNIRFQGCNMQINGHNIGGHLKFNNGFALGQIQGVEFVSFGQGDIVGRYPIHFHLCAQAPPRTFVRANSIHDAFMRAVAIHGTQNVLVDNNVAYNISGHAMFLEDGAEFGNIFSSNLVALVRQKLDGPFRLGSDDQTGLSAFWLTNANNTFINNVVAGVEGTGFWLHTRLRVKEQSYGTGLYNNIVPFTTPLKLCTGNRVHSVWNGFRIDSANFDNGDQPKMDYGTALSQAYSPTSITIIKDFTVYHARQGGWFRIFEIVLDNWKLGDVREGIQFLTTGNTATAPVNGTVRNTLFVGDTGNRGNPVNSVWQVINHLEGRSESNFLLTDLIKIGMVLYDGPHYLENCTFVNYYSQPCMNYINPAIGARAFNTFMMATTTYITNSKFINTPYPMYLIDRQSDGGRTTSIIDTSGSISGMRNAVILPDWDFYYTLQCQRNAKYGLACPHQYNNFEVVQIDNDASNLAKYGQLQIARLNLDSSLKSPPSFAFAGQYIPEAGGYLYHPILSVGAFYMMNFLTRTPPILRFNLVNGYKGDIHTIGVTYPLGTTISSVMDNQGLPLGKMNSLTDTSCTSCYYFDSPKSILVFRMQQLFTRTDIAMPCPPSGCPSVIIKAVFPSSFTGVNDVATRSYPLLTTSNDAWAKLAFNRRLASSQSFSSSPINTNWCSLNDACLNSIDKGNLDQGIMAFTDSPCNGIGCFSPKCRYCKLSSSSSNQPFVPCPFKTSTSQTASTTSPPILTSAPSTPKPTQAPPILTNAPSTLTPTPVNTIPLTTPANPCQAMVSPGDAAVGISAIEDKTCPTSTIAGCIGFSQCRYCRVTTTPQSANFVYCTYVAATVVVATAAPNPTPAPSTQAPTTCQISPGDYAVGLGMIYDSTCTTQGGIGCVGNTPCRFCKRTANQAYASYISCPSAVVFSVLQDENSMPGSPWIAPIVVVVIICVLTALMVGALWKYCRISSKECKVGAHEVEKNAEDKTLSAEEDSSKPTQQEEKCVAEV